MKKSAAATVMTAVLTLSLISISSTADTDPPEKNGVLLFNSGFEPGSEIFHRSDPFTGDDKIRGQDTSVAPPNDWINDIDNSEYLGSFSLQYQGGDTTRRVARIIPEPGNPDNNVLMFRIHEPWVNASGSRLARIQANLYDSDFVGKSITEYYQTVRLFLHEDMEHLKNYPNRIHWLTIFEAWNNRSWGGTPNAYRLTVGINKTSAASRDLIFSVIGEDHGNGGYTELWSELNEDHPIPVGQWLDLEFYMKEGNDETGRFYMTMTPEGEDKIVLFDLHEYTPCPPGEL
jgi:hypothetical protein